MERARWDALTQEQREKFAPLCPDFVVELRSRTDRLADLQEKMQEYLDNGAELGWLIDPKSVEHYQNQEKVAVVVSYITGEDLSDALSQRRSGW